MPEFAAATFSGAVASFNEVGLSASTGDFLAMIDWGDGTPLTTGTITQPGGPGTAFLVGGSHTYADAGVNGGTGRYTVVASIRDLRGLTLQIRKTAGVADTAIILAGRLNPASDLGVSDSDAITSVVQPAFLGSSEPFSNVTLYAARSGGTPVVIGHARTDGNGAWSLRSDVALADGHYIVTATAIDQFGMTTAGSVVIAPDLTIDTRGPVITAATFYRTRGRVDFTIVDPEPGAGAYLASLFDSANYGLVSATAPRSARGQWLVTSVSVTPIATTGNAYRVSVTFNHGKNLGTDRFYLAIRGTVGTEPGVMDLAGNRLDGEFYGKYPSGNGINGGDFLARFAAGTARSTPARTVIGTVNGPESNTVARLFSAATHPRARAARARATRASLATARG
ncbi:MAG: Ig-like domain-containing protein [Isosphaeraceae bacterium]